MAVYCITFEMNYNIKHYNNLFNAIKGYGTWYNQNKNVWFVVGDDNNNTAVSIRDYLYQYMYKNDKLFVIKIADIWAGTGYKQDEYDWLKQYVG